MQEALAEDSPVAANFKVIGQCSLLRRPAIENCAQWVGPRAGGETASAAVASVVVSERTNEDADATL